MGLRSVAGRLARRPRLLIIGCGDVGLRVAARLPAGTRVLALARSPETAARLRAAGIVPIPGDLDRFRSLGRLAGLAPRVLHLAPPPAEGADDPRTARLLAALARGGMLPQALCYISTTGVYGDRAGARVSELSPARPGSARGRRRLAAETRLRAFGRRGGTRVSILRVPGIYAADRLPLERIRAGTPMLAHGEDGYTNLVHADDLAAMVLAALRQGPPGRVYNAGDGSELRMGEWFDRVADAFGLPRPPRIPRAQAAGRISPAMLSYLDESRRVDSTRIRRELRLSLRYPSAAEGLAAAAGKG